MIVTLETNKYISILNDSFYVSYFDIPKNSVARIAHHLVSILLNIIEDTS